MPVAEILPKIQTTIDPGATVGTDGELVAESDEFGPLLFCTAEGFDLYIERCLNSISVFSGVIEWVYVSWRQSPEYETVDFMRDWHYEDTLFVTGLGQTHYDYVEIDKRPSLAPGRYRVELYVGEGIGQVGEFVIEE